MSVPRPATSDPVTGTRVATPAPLRRALAANAAFSAASGALLVALPGAWAGLFGLAVPVVFTVLGAGLLLFAAVVAWTAWTRAPRPALVTGIVVADLTWVVATPVVMLAGSTRIDPAGQVLLAVVAAVVATFAGLQWRGLRRMLTAVP